MGSKGRVCVGFWKLRKQGLERDREGVMISRNECVIARLEI